ncbi:hypothetical protein [Oceanisphaera sp. W20_SRM_FM3]|uniref:hypothetical protein n=1 Tax=Oceanisphaera sp. W20_SRM_FM3 TaxID=3240267 RepID=UPI003F9CC890
MATNMPAENSTDEKFITGIDTQLKINKADSQNEKLQSLGFLSFLEEVQDELNTAVAVFINVNGHDVEQIKKDQVDLNSLFADHSNSANSANYQDFLVLFARTKANIEQLVAATGPEQLAHQGIVDEVVNLRAFIEARYANPTTELEPKSGKRKIDHYLGAGIVLLPIIFAWLTLRKGYSNWLRIGAFIWLGVFLYFTTPNPKETVAPAPAATEARPASEEQDNIRHEKNQQELEQEEKE